MSAPTEREKARQELADKLAPIIDRMEEHISAIEAQLPSIQAGLERLERESDA